MQLTAYEECQLSRRTTLELCRLTRTILELCRLTQSLCARLLRFLLAAPGNCISNRAICAVPSHFRQDCKSRKRARVALWHTSCYESILNLFCGTPERVNPPEATVSRYILILSSRSCTTYPGRSRLQPLGKAARSQAASPQSGESNYISGLLCSVNFTD